MRGWRAKQSSTDYGADARRAVDGNSDTNWGSNSCTHNSGVNPWWALDLGRAQWIDALTIINRMDCCTSEWGRRELLGQQRRRCVNLRLANPSACGRCHSSPQGWQSH